MSIDLTALGWDADFQAAYAPHARADQHPARVARVDRGVCTVIGSEGPQRVTVGGGLLAAAAHDLTRMPSTGDWVAVRHWPDDRDTIEAVLPRRTAIIRASAGAESLPQVLAANVDTVAVVAPVDPEPDLGLIERLLAVAWESGAQPLVILTKADLARDPETIAAEIAEIAPGVEVHSVSATTGAGLHMLRGYVAAGRTLGLLGPSGAGKSTLVNALAGAVVMDTQAIRRTDGRGRHTTTHRALVPLPGGGTVLDTPGVRAVGLFDAGTGLEQTFADVEAFAETCRFRDCTHAREPGCAVVAALATGELAPRRMESYRKLQREIAHEARRHDARLAAMARLRWRRLSAESRGGARP
jgi:ribosome biogenesis GTPase